MGFLFFFFNYNWICWVPSAGRMLKFLCASIYLFKNIWNLRNFFNHPLSTLAAIAVSERLILDIDPTHFYWNGANLLWCSLKHMKVQYKHRDPDQLPSAARLQYAKVSLDEELLAQRWGAQGTRQTIFYLSVCGLHKLMDHLPIR